MNDKEMIEEMKKDLCNEYHEDCICCCASSNICTVYEDCENLYNAGYRKIPENAVGLTKEEYENLCFNMLETKKQARNINDMNGQLIIENQTLKQSYKKTTREIANEVKIAFYREFDELIPSIMADKIDEIADRYGVEQ